ncbi:hypothetical protein GQ43DRAFT_136246 [Delitschia confertaspora ATCC 74209]|uniref:Uncharacterized protein n=1 Tax=Delitschia confertaspora ATCC 74209 TaxID=1513339 RepID=A0A9P4JT64_9PLEO|nr:hypothetical protein GQ43DRAFT_136246 [Delitschia confertaspora ATCC 74209]
MSDIDKSFTFLQTNIPQWVKNVGDIEEKVASMQNEIAKVPVSRAPPIKRRSGSVESVRDSPKDMTSEERITSTTRPENASPCPRKRKSPSALSGQGDGALKYRSRSMIVVQYDGQIQQSFEALVRQIGTGRNLLRKAKMAAKMEALAELAGAEFSEDDDDDEDPNPMLAKISYRHRSGLAALRATRTRMSGRGLQSGGNAAPTQLFDETDKALEQAQALCETGAHQSLRDGDCRKELGGVRKQLETVLEIATREAAKHAVQREDSMQETSGEPSPIQSSSPGDIGSKPPAIVSIPPPAINMDTLKPIAIEVDEDEEDFIMPPVRLTSRLTARV